MSGSDRATSALTADLELQGISVSTDQSGNAIPEGCELLVYSEAVPEDAPERMEAAKRGIVTLSYPEAVGDLSRGYTLVCVCGSHGKSSTTGMSARLMLEAGLDPTIIVGTKLPELAGRNWRKGKSDLFLLEACEYRRSFLNYAPNIILLTNADGDHFDYFTSHEDYLLAFKEFGAHLPPHGSFIIHGADRDSKAIADSTGANVINADTQELITLKTPGAHMRRNAQLVLALAEVLKIPLAEAKKSISGYAGSWRRLEVKGERSDGVTVMDDYAHHPVEIRASLSAIREANPGRRIVCVFQPHTHDRTIKLYKEFLEAFSDCDVLVIPNIYDARHSTETAFVDPEEFCKDLAKTSGKPVTFTQNLENTEKKLRQEMLQAGDVLVCMGAGDITNLAERMVK